MSVVLLIYCILRLRVKTNKHTYIHIHTHNQKPRVCYAMLALIRLPVTNYDTRFRIRFPCIRRLMSQRHSLQTFNRIVYSFQESAQ